MVISPESQVGICLSIALQIPPGVRCRILAGIHSSILLMVPPGKSPGNVSGAAHGISKEIAPEILSRTLRGIPSLISHRISLAISPKKSSKVSPAFLFLRDSIGMCTSPGIP